MYWDLTNIFNTSHASLGLMVRLWGGFQRFIANQGRLIWVWISMTKSVGISTHCWQPAKGNNERSDWQCSYVMFGQVDGQWSHLSFRLAQPLTIFIFPHPHHPLPIPSSETYIEQLSLIPPKIRPPHKTWFRGGWKNIFGSIKWGCLVSGRWD